jgi:putative restriction endonuclease
MERGRSGFIVCRYRLRRVPDQPVPWQPPPAQPGRAPRVQTWVQRIVRDTEVARHVKSLYGCACQVCGTVINTPAGAYAEAAHVRPLGAPHHGPDDAGNVLCLCPNHHVMFDRGSLSVNDDLALVGVPGRLTLHRDHLVNSDHLRYHREHFSIMNERRHAAQASVPHE